jgi:hypothetical protein
MSVKQVLERRRWRPGLPSAATHLDRHFAWHISRGCLAVGKHRAPVPEPRGTGGGPSGTELVFSCKSFSTGACHACCVCFLRPCWSPCWWCRRAQPPEGRRAGEAAGGGREPPTHVSLMALWMPTEWRGASGNRNAISLKTLDNNMMESGSREMLPRAWACGSRVAAREDQDRPPGPLSSDGPRDWQDHRWGLLTSEGGSRGKTGRWGSQQRFRPRGRRPPLGPLSGGPACRGTRPTKTARRLARAAEPEFTSACSRV